MDRCVVIVDAGYLYAEGAKAYLDPKAKRGDAAIDHKALVESLCHRARTASGLPLLRTYWYDGAVDAVPTAEQQDVAALPNVKLRLGRLTNGRQKGVDALVYRDLSVLSRERAVSEIYLVSGDEDLREGVVTAQELGSRVTLWGLGQQNQARTLVAEVDDVVHLDDIAQHFSVAAGSALALARPSPSAATQAVPDDTAVARTGRDHALTWLKKATGDELGELLALRPGIPGNLDSELLRRAQAEHGSLRDRPTARRALRDGFWEVIVAIQASTLDSNTAPDDEDGRPET